MKKLFVLVLVLTLLSVMATPAFAAGGPPGGNGNGSGGSGGNGSGGDGNGSEAGEINRIRKMPFALAGTIASLDPATRTVTVAVVSGNTLVKPYLGQNLVLQTTDLTRFLLRNPDGVATPIAYKDLAIGQNVSAIGQPVDNVWTASRITVGAELTNQP